MRNVVILLLAQALSAAGMMTMFLLGGILGSELAPAPLFATLPLSLVIFGLASATIPAALLMERFGRRNAFIASALFAALAACAVSYAIVISSFLVFCLAALVLGSNLAFQLQHRFAAAECVEPEQVGRAVSLVMVGTLIAAIAGPPLALALKDLVADREYAGSFLGVAGLCLATALVLTRYQPAPHAPRAELSRDARPLREVIREPAYVVAVLAGVVSYAVMSFIMTATPISMHVIDHHSDTQTAWVIQGHLLGMYLPSLASGVLIARIGVRRGMSAGLLLMGACVVIDLQGQQVMHYWWGLLLLGIGWNLLFVSGTVLLTTTYRPAERFRAQAVNEFSIFGTQALASLMAGPAIHLLGWKQLNLLAVPPMIAFAVALAIWTRRLQRSRNSRT